MNKPVRSVTVILLTRRILEGMRGQKKSAAA
jgi:hypothetical protein